MSLIIGSHVSFKSDTQLLGSVEEALSYGANTFMIYTGAPQNTRRGVINDKYTYEAYKLMKDNDMALENVIVHAPYIINLCNEFTYLRNKNKGVLTMEKELFVRAEEVARELGVSKPYAYKLVREMNEELKKKGFLTIPGRVSRRYFEEKFYGLRDRQ